MSVSALPLLQNVIQTQKETPTVQNCRMIFIVGASRSGTTLLARMLGKHSNIAYVQETQFFDDIWPVRSANSVIGNDIGRKIVMRIVARALPGLLSVDQKILAEAVDSVIVRTPTRRPRVFTRGHSCGWPPSSESGRLSSIRQEMSITCTTSCSTFPRHTSSVWLEIHARLLHLGSGGGVCGVWEPPKSRGSKPHVCVPTIILIRRADCGYMQLDV